MKQLIRSSYHNYQGRGSYKAPNEVGVKSEPTSVMKQRRGGNSRIAPSTYIKSWASGKEKRELQNTPVGDRKYYIACSFKWWIMCPISDSTLDKGR